MDRAKRIARRHWRRAERWQVTERRRQYVRAWLNAYPFGWIMLDVAQTIIGTAVFALLLRYAHAHIAIALIWFVCSVTVTISVHRWLSRAPLRVLP